MKNYEILWSKNRTKLRNIGLTSCNISILSDFLYYISDDRWKKDIDGFVFCGTIPEICKRIMMTNTSFSRGMKKIKELGIIQSKTYFFDEKPIRFCKKTIKKSKSHSCAYFVDYNKIEEILYNN